jgi:hypothetical protein
MSKAFDTVNLHKLSSKLLRTNIPNTIKKFTINYLKGRIAYTVYQNNKSKKSLLKYGVPQGGVLSPILFNLYLSDLPTPPDSVQLESYADDLTTISTNSNLSQAKNNLQPYLNEIYNWTVENNLSLNPLKSTATIFSLDSSENNQTLDLRINNKIIPTVKNPKILGLTFDPLLKFNKHLNTISETANKRNNIIKALTSTSWGKQKETLIITYKAITRPTLEYASTIWYPIVSKTNIEKLQTIQNTALRTATGCTKDTNTQHLHEETLVLPLKEHLTLHASQLKQKAKNPKHPLHSLLNKTSPKSKKKRPKKPNKKPPRLSIFNTDSLTINPKLALTINTENSIKLNMKTIHSTIVSKYLLNLQNNKIINQTAPAIHQSEQNLSRKTRRTLAQLRTGKSPFLLQYKHKIDPIKYTSKTCPLCQNHDHDTYHLFNCPMLPTTLTTHDLWNNPAEVSGLLEAWSLRLGLA